MKIKKCVLLVLSFLLLFSPLYSSVAYITTKNDDESTPTQVDAGLVQKSARTPQIAQTLAWDDNGTVICNASGNQYRPQICSDGDGGAIITWYDPRGIDFDIYAQKIDSNGNFPWGDDNGAIISNALGDQYKPQICCDGDGGALITWRDERGIDYDIYAQKIDSNGNFPWGDDNGTIISNALGEQSDPQICCDGDGGALITWIDERRGIDYDIYAQKIDSNGNLPWGDDNGTVICNASGNQLSPQICSDGDGGAIITWNDERRGFNSDIYAQKIDSNGNFPWGDDNGIIICNASGSQSIPQICSDGDGDALITWRDPRGIDSDIYAQKIDSNGNFPWGDDNGIIICNASGGQYSPQICSDGDGGAIISWEDSRGVDYDIYAQKIDSNGNFPWGDDNGTIICNALDYQSDPRICSDGDGDALITWRDERGIDYDIYAQKIDSNGNFPWGDDNGTIISNALGDQSDPRICSDGDGGAIISWEDERGIDSDIYAQKIKGTVRGILNPLLLLTMMQPSPEQIPSYSPIFIIFATVIATYSVIIIFRKRRGFNLS